MLETSFNRGSKKGNHIIYPFRIKIPFIDYNTSVEDFCYTNFSNNWCLRFYNEKFRPLAIGQKVYYIVGFKYEEDAVYFKLTFQNASPLTDEELNWDNVRSINL